MMYLSKEAARALVLLQIAANEKAIELSEKIKPVILKFDGKVPNKRLDTALKAVDDNLMWSMEYNSAIIKMWIENRSTSEGNTPDSYGYRTTNYLTDNTVNIAYGRMVDGSNPAASVCPDGKLNAAALISAVDSSSAYLKQSVSDMRSSLTRIDELIEQRAALVKAVEDYNNSIDYTVATYFDLRMNIARN
jgi:hypothetical protein